MTNDHCCCNSASNAKTLENLLAAYNGESNAHAKYAVYADKARQDGYLSVASLFAAASAAERLHAARHARVIESLGGQAVANVQTYSGKDVAEMLQDAIAGETEEFTHMYPAFIKTAQDEGQKSAVLSFEGAMKAEVMHADFYREALENLDDWKSDTLSFFVCPVCGWTEMKQAPNRCPICSIPAEKFLSF